MERSDLSELQYITHLDNLPSILRLGILCHEMAAKIEHISVAMEDVQDVRAGVRVPGGLRLHQYANLYFNARNTMMFKRHGNHQKLRVVSIKSAILDTPGVVLSDCNAASVGFAEFGTSDEILPKLGLTEIFAESWNHSDYYEKRRHKARMCAEVLVPRRIAPEAIRGVYVSCDETQLVMQARYPNVKFKVNPYLFFQGPRP